MSSVSLTEKITVAEAHEWLKNASMEWGLTHHEAEAFVEDVTGIRPRDFQAPKAKRGPNKNSISPEERRCLPYDPTRCDAGVYAGPRVGGFRVQCKCKADGVCKTHQKVVDKHGMPRDGYFNQECPTHPFNDETKPPTPWEGVEVPEKKKGRKTSGGERKATTCSHCGEVGHNKRTCPNLDQEAKKAKKPVKKPKKSLEDEKADLLKKLAALEKKQGEDVEDKPADTAETDSGAGVYPDGLNSDSSQSTLEQQTEPEPESQPVLARAPSQSDLTNSELEEDTTEYQASAADADDETITVEDEADETIDCSFEGVEYVRDNSGTVFDMPEMDAVGTWDEDSQSISFEKHALKAHKKMRDPVYN